MADFYETVRTVLKEDERFVAEDGTFLRNAVCEAAMKMDKQLIRLLLKNEETRNRFFTDVDDIKVFDKTEFAWVINNRQFLPDSYTRFKNKIGLADENGEMLSASGKVELVFPYKDCILEGGQTKEDQKRSEIFYNESLAPNEVDRLLYPKVFAGAKRFSIEENKVVEAQTDEFISTDNLIIKGNNLLVLASLLKRYEGKIKCIYIDPPYNTGSDSFGYNDKFLRSTWLSFMKTRLQLSRRLLASDGIILIQCSFHQYPYLRVLADEILRETCHQFDMNTLVRHPDRSLTSDKEFNDVVEYTLIYARSESFKMPKREIAKTEKDYKYDIALPQIPHETISLGGKDVKVYLPNTVTITCKAGHIGGLKSMSIRGSIREKNSSGRFYVAYLEKLINQYPEGTFFAVPGMGDDGLPFRLFELPKNGNKNGIYYPGKPTNADVTRIPYPNFMDFVQQYNLVNDEGGYSFRNGKKPEEFIAFYLDIFTNKGDLVLDFCLGSGTTAAAAHRMGRHYIGIDQMDYIDSIAVPRLCGVISGEQSGISEQLNWRGGGSFVYCELVKLNQAFVDEIEAAANSETLSGIYSRIVKSGFISCKVKPADIEGAAEDFSVLSLDEQKRFLMELLDKNLLYVNLCDIDDEEFDIGDSDKAFTKSFYGEG